MWQKMTLAFPDQLSAISCNVSTVTPWTYGAAQVTDSGSYLSPENAINFLSEKLSTSGGTPDVVIFLLTGTQINGFIESIGALADIFPLPDFTKAARKAAAQASLALTKMLLPGAQTADLSISSALPVSTCRRALNAQRIASAAASAGQGSSIGNIESMLTQFAATAQQAETEAAQTLENLQGKSLDLWVFNGTGAPSNVANNMKVGIPQTDAIFTMGTMFVGELSSLKEMLMPWQE